MEDLLAFVDIIFLRAVEEKLGRPDLVGAQNAQGPLDPALFDQGGDGLIDVPLLDGVIPRIGRQELVVDPLVLGWVFVRQRERRKGEAQRRNSHGGYSMVEIANRQIVDSRSDRSLASPRSRPALTKGG